MSNCEEKLPCQMCPQLESCNLDQGEHGRWLVSQRLQHVRNRLLVLSNKGGVGKSTIAANLAVALAARGQRVGLLDADLSGPSIPHLMGVADARLPGTPAGVEPAVAPSGVRVASVGFMLQSPDDPIIWRDSFKFEFLVELVGGVHWGELDWLVVDMPPGTGGEFIALSDLLKPLTGAVAVSTPHALARLDVRKALSACDDAGVPVLGLVENMAALTCPHCGGEVRPWGDTGVAAMAAERNIPLLASIPLDPAVQALTDAGQPFVTAAPESAAARALLALADACLHRAAAAG